MNKFLLIIASIYFVLIIVLSGGLFFVNAQTKNVTNLDRLDKEAEQAKQHQEFLMLRDPKTNAIPAHIRQLELKYAKTLPRRQEYVMMKGRSVKNVQSLTWTERGPNNIGGRTLAIGIDIKDTSIVLAGSASGGIWRSTNSGASWTLVTSVSSPFAITALVQDTRSGKESTWYAGTGEYSGTEFDDKGQTNRYIGTGIYKSTDDGQSWSLLSSTAVTQPQDPTQSSFSFINSMAIDPSNNTNDVVYAATYNGIYKSTDGGSTWNASLQDNQYYSPYSEVAVTSTGIVYATIGDSTLSAGGIYTSTNAGGTWTKITPSGLTSYNRIVIGISPSNENIVYFFGDTPGEGKLGRSGDYMSLWKYDASTTGWTDLSSALPSEYGNVAGLNSQGSYNMFVTVAPNTSSTVIIGTTNIYRSTNGFADTTATTWIGGYSPANDVSSYPNHHPDCHCLVFQPGSNVDAYSGHDGGISVTYDITASNAGTFPVAWNELDNTYDVTQLYSVSLAPESGSNVIAGGAQDNGNLETSSSGLSSWTSLQGGGDGQYDVVAPLSDNIIYAEVQNGDIYSLDRSNNYNGDLTPITNGNQLFTNPFALDPNNSALLYYAAGNSTSNSGVWRNTAINSGTFPSITWTFLTSTEITGAQVSDIGISTANSANVVYFGTSAGKAYRMDGANTGSNPTVTDITSSNFPAGYVSWIAVDPTNSNKAMLLFSNYNVERIWYTTDGGYTWADESGNLSAATAPSTRSAKIFNISGTTYYFLATSTGVYYTSTLNGASTVWTQEATTTVGNAVCSMLDYRPADNTLAVATHGRGAFTAVVNSALPVELVSFAGTASEGKVNLVWQTATEVDNYGFDIERSQKTEVSSQNPQWENIGFVKGSGNSNIPESYSFVDNDPLNGSSSGQIEYRLKMINNDGSFKYSDIVEISFNNPLTYKLFQNYPNPFNPTTTIQYAIPKAEHVTLKVYDELGREVTTLVNENKEAGQYRVNFNGSNFASGIYFYRITAGSFSQAKKLMLLK